MPQHNSECPYRSQNAHCLYGRDQSGQDQESVKAAITYTYTKGKISEQHYVDLKNEISVLYEDIYKKRIDSLNGDGVSMDKIKEDIEDAYAKGKITDQHYNLLIARISAIKNERASADKLSSSQRSRSTAQKSD